MSTIPASEIANVTPSVLAAGGSALDLVGLVLTTTARIPIGTVQSFATQTAVANYFGSSSPEANLATKYFLGFDNSTAKPGSVLFAQYNAAAASAFLRGGNVSTLTLAQIQAINGTLSVTIDSVVKSASISLAAATSLSNAAVIITDALVITGVTTAVVTASQGATFTGTGAGTNLTTSAVTGVIHPGDSVTGTGVPGGTTIVSQTSGTTGGAGVYVTSAATTSAGAALTTTSTTMEVTGLTSGAIAVGNVLSGAGVSADTYVTALGTGTGGVGTYITSVAQQHASTTVTAKVPGVVYDSVSGGFQINSGTTGATSTITFATGAISAALALTSATGAVLSQGAAAAVPGAFMDGIVSATQNWASFLLGFDPDNGSGNAQKLLFAQWTNGKSNRYAFICWDTDASPTTTVPATTSLGALIATSNLSGTILIYTPLVSSNASGAVAAFIAGAIASISFTSLGGRTTLAFRSQTGLVADVTVQTIAANLIANAYNYYGAFATANTNFVFFNNGTCSGPFLWADSYIDQVWLNNSLQLALMTLLTGVGSIPYNNAGFAQIESALADPINAGVNFGAIRAGIQLSASQISAVNNAAGLKIDGTLSQRGWYLQISSASPTVRQARNSPPTTFWYVDGQSIQKINVTSTELT